MGVEAGITLHDFIYVDQAGFNLNKLRIRGRNVIGHQATNDVPDQGGGNIVTDLDTFCTQTDSSP